MLTNGTFCFSRQYGYLLLNQAENAAKKALVLKVNTHYSVEFFRCLPDEFCVVVGSEVFTINGHSGQETAESPK